MSGQLLSTPPNTHTHTDTHTHLSQDEFLCCIHRLYHVAEDCVGGRLLTAAVCTVVEVGASSECVQLLRYDSVCMQRHVDSDMTTMPRA